MTHPEVVAVVRDVLAQSADYCAWKIRQKYVTGKAGQVPTPWPISNTNGPSLSDAAYGLTVAYTHGLFSDLVLLKKLVRSLARGHRANQPTSSWPTVIARARHAADLGEIGWLLKDVLSARTQAAIHAVLAFEADRAKVIYMRDRNGKLLTPGDSGAESCAWTFEVCAAACTYLPDHPRVPAWERTGEAAAAAAFARPSDVSEEMRLRGSNVTEDGLITNHGITPNVRYQAGTFRTLGVGARIYGHVPEHDRTPFMYAATDCYQILTERLFNGRTIYVPHSADIYYPGGDDSRIPLNKMSYALADAVEWRYGPQKDLALTFCGLHANAMRALQLRPGMKGRTYAKGETSAKATNAEQQLCALTASTLLMLEV